MYWITRNAYCVRFTSTVCVLLHFVLCREMFSVCLTAEMCLHFPSSKSLNIIFVREMCQEMSTDLITSW